MLFSSPVTRLSRLSETLLLILLDLGVDLLQALCEQVGRLLCYLTGNRCCVSSSRGVTSCQFDFKVEAPLLDDSLFLL